MAVRRIKAPVGYHFMIDPITNHSYLMRTVGRRYTPHSKGVYFSALSLSIVEGEANKNLNPYRTFKGKNESGNSVEYVVENEPITPAGKEECTCTRRCRRRQVGSSGSSNTYGYSYEWSEPYDGDCKCHKC